MNSQATQHQTGKHDFAGACAPMARGEPTYETFETFSVGVFEWITKANRGLKRGPVKVRVKGRTDDPERVYEKAREIVLALDAGVYTGPKRVTVI